MFEHQFIIAHFIFNDIIGIVFQILHFIFKDYLTVRLRTDDRSVEGVRVNEDAFTIQVRDVSVAIQSFRKDELQAFDKVFGHSLMPGYETVLNDRDLDDVVSYLMSLKE